MTTHRPGGLSPPPRRYGDPRLSSPTVFASSFDTRYSAQPRTSVDSLTTPRGGADRLYDAQPIAKVTYPDSSHSGTISRTEYAVRPRQNSSAADEGRKASSLLTPLTSPIRTRPLVTNSGRERPRSPPPLSRFPQNESDRMIYPAITNPRQNYTRHLGATPNDLEPLPALDRDRRDRGGYRSPGMNGQRVYSTNGPLVIRSHQDEDDYSYTGPREQFNRDYPAALPPRRSSYSRRDRKVVPVDVKDFPERRLNPPSARRQSGPPPSATRQFDKLGTSDRRSGGRSGTGSDAEREPIAPRRRHSVRGPVSLHQERDDGYVSQRDDGIGRQGSHTRKQRTDEDYEYTSDFEDRHKSSHHERRKNRNSSLDRTDTGKGLAAVGLGGIAAAGLASGLQKDSRGKDHDSDREARRERRERRERRHRERSVDGNDDESRDDQGRLVDRPSDRNVEIPDQGESRGIRHSKSRKDRSGSDSMDEENEGRRRHHRRRRHRNKEESSRPGDSESDSDDHPVLDAPRNDVRGGGRDGDNESEPRKHERARYQEREIALPEENIYAELPLPEPEETRTRRVQLVEPTKERELEVKPKGILKPARQVPFPEDPNPTREGVAPLKEAGQKGIPPDARWTKINRKLVNPAALEAKHERFEEREDYVIVLRVLSKEDIQKLADKTREIRLAREKEWEERPKRSGDERYREDDSSGEDERRPPLAIEAPPPAQADPRFLAPQGVSSNPYVPVAAMAGLNIRPE